MEDGVSRRKVVLPPPEAPHWLAVGRPGALLYLGWGRRQYGRFPIVGRRHEGWTYTVVQAGHPVALLNGETWRTEPGALVAAGPDVVAGWTDSGDAVSRILVWLWAGPDSASGDTLCCKQDGWITGQASRSRVERLESLHGIARREIRSLDGHSDRVYAALRALVDAEFARAIAAPREDDERQVWRYRLALDWMRQQVDQRVNLSALADYLGVSRVTLQRLFLEEAGTTPGRVYHGLRMTVARQRLQQGVDSVKAVGLGLGYRNPGDFTRAYTRYFGYPPSATSPVFPPVRKGRASRDRGQSFTT